MSRELVEPSTLFVDGRPGTKLFTFDPTAKYVLFIDPSVVGPDFAADWTTKHPECSVQPLNVPPGKTLDDLLCVFKEK